MAAQLKFIFCREALSSLSFIDRPKPSLGMGATFIVFPPNFLLVLSSLCRCEKRFLAASIRFPDSERFNPLIPSLRGPKPKYKSSLLGNFSFSKILESGE